MAQGKFYRREGTSRIPIPEKVLTNRTAYWVTVDFRDFNQRIRFRGAGGLLRIYAEQCRSGVATITDRPVHHDQPSCLSLPVVGQSNLPRAEILSQAADVADWHYDEIDQGREWLDDESIMASLQPVRRINAA
jgi:hypothetical protein